MCKHSVLTITNLSNANLFAKSDNNMIVGKRRYKSL